MAVGLPQGFVLDSAPSVANGLPEGFVLDEVSGPKVKPDASEPGLLPALKRGAGGAVIGAAQLLKDAGADALLRPFGRELPSRDVLNAAAQSIQEQSTGTGLKGFAGEVLGNPLTYAGGATLPSAIATGVSFGATSPLPDDKGLLDRGISSVIGAGAGAAGYGVGRALAAGVSRAGNSELVKQFVADESGKILGNQGYKAPFSPAERTVVRNLIEQRGFTPEQAAEFVSKAGKPGEGGIPLTLPEATGSKELLAYDRILRENPGAAGETLGQFTTQRATEGLPVGYNSAISENIGRISSPTAAGGRASEAAQQVISAAQAKRAEAVRPLYAAAYAQVLPDDVAGNLVKNPVVRNAYEAISRDPVWQAEIAQHPQGSLGAFDVTKRYLDDQIESATRAGENARKRILLQAKDSLVSQMDEASPAYQLARQTFAKASPRIERLQDSVVGVLADIDDPAKASAKLFKSSPADIAFARRVIRSTNPEAWDTLIATHMADIGDAANHSPLKILNQLSSTGSAGNKLRERAFNAALTPQQRAAKDRVFKDLFNAGLVRQGSITEGNMAARQGLNDALDSPFDQAINAAKSGITVPQLAAKAWEWGRRQILQKRYDELAKIFTGQGADDFAERIAATKPGSLESWRLINDRIARTGSVSARPGATAVSPMQNNSAPVPTANDNPVAQATIEPLTSMQTMEVPVSPLDGYADKVSLLESSGNPNAKAATSSAEGAHQFTNATWNQIVNRYGKEYGLTHNGRTDAAQSTIATNLLAQENAPKLASALGRDPDAAELYLAHVMGAGGARALIRNADKPIAAATLNPAAAKANRALFFANGKPLTPAQVIDNLRNIFDSV